MGDTEDGATGKYVGDGEREEERGGNLGKSPREEQRADEGCDEKEENL